MKQTISIIDIYRKEIPIHCLKYVEGSSNYSILHLLNSKPVIISRNLSKLEGELSYFLRIHKKYLVNPQFISSHRLLSPYTMVLLFTTGEILTVAKRRIAHVRAALT